MFGESGHRFGFLSPRSAIFDSDRNQVSTNLRSSGSISVESDVKANLPSGFGLSNFIVFNCISRVDRFNHCSKSREISCLKHLFLHFIGPFNWPIRAFNNCLSRIKQWWQILWMVKIADFLNSTWTIRQQLWIELQWMDWILDHQDQSRVQFMTTFTQHSLQRGCSKYGLSDWNPLLLKLQFYHWYSGYNINWNK